MAARLSWAKIRATYPGEYVVIVDARYDEATSLLLGGRVLDHSQDQNAMFLRLGGLGVQGAVCLWTGGKVPSASPSEDAGGPLRCSGSAWSNIARAGSLQT